MAKSQSHAVLSAICLGGIVSFSTVGCNPRQGNTNNTGAPKTTQKVNLVQWTYYGPAQLAATQFEKLHPNIHVTVKVFPGSDYETKLQAALSTNTQPPDIFDLDMGYIGKFINTPYVADLSKMGANALTKNMIPYVVAGGKMSNGDIGAVTDTSSPGGFWYNRKAAKKWLGTDDPVKVSNMVNSWSKISALGTRINKASGGKVHLLDFAGDVMAVEQYHMQNFVQNGKLVIDPKWSLALNQMRTLSKNGITAQLPTFGSGWGNALNDHSANPAAILFAVPSWAGFMLNSKTANGNYGIASAPQGYYEGGRYAAMYAQSPKKQAAYQFLQYLASDAWQTWNLKNTANMPSLKTVYQKNMNRYTYPWFGNQRILQMYYKISMDVPPQTQDEYNQDIISDMGGIASTMVAQNKTNQWAFQQLKAQVKAAYPNVQVD